MTFDDYWRVVAPFFASVDSPPAADTTFRVRVAGLLFDLPISDRTRWEVIEAL
jgi:hypothetical protein